MEQPYKKQILDVQGKKDAIIKVDGTADLEGEVKEVEESGFLIYLKGPKENSVISMFVDYKDVRGVGSVEWDLESL